MKVVFNEIIAFSRRVGFHIVALLAFFLIDPYQKNFLAGYLLTAFIYIKKDFILRRIDTDFVLIQAFAIVYALFSLIDPEIFTQTVIFYGVFPPVFFLLGRYLMSKTKRVDDIFVILFTVGMLYSVSALLSVTFNLKSGGYANFDRAIPMIWSGSKPMKATLMAAFFTFNMCIPALTLVQLKKFNIAFKAITLLIFVQSLLCVFRLGSRTQLAIFLITTALTLLFILPKQSLNQNIRLLLLLAASAVLVYIYIPFDLDSEYLSTIGQRLQNSDNTGSAGGRTTRWTRSLENLFIKPLGWDKTEFGYAHNLWLDVARTHGIIPFIILIIFSVRTLLNTKKAIRFSKVSLPVTTLFFSYVLAANLMFFVEPVTEGIFSFFLVYCFIQGFIREYIHLMGKRTLKKPALSSFEPTGKKIETKTIRQ